MVQTSRVRVVHPATPAVEHEAVIAEETAGELEQKTVIFRTYQVIWYVLEIIETLIFLRFLFKLLGASILSPFVRLLYDLSGFFVGPFIGIFPVAAVDRAVLEWASLVAMLIYALLAYGIVYLFQLIKPTNVIEVEQTVDNP